MREASPPGAMIAGILRALAERPGLTWVQLADRARVPAVAMVEAVNVLVASGLVRFEAVPAEGSPGELVPGLRLTEAGESAVPGPVPLGRSVGNH